MKVNNININFGRSLIAKCDISDLNKRARQASLYEYYPESYEDSGEMYNLCIESGMNGRFYNSFLQGNRSKFFVLKDDVNDKTIAISEITKHIAPNNPIMGNYIEINDIEANEAYSDAYTPIIAHISNLARLNGMDNIATYSSNITTSNFEKYGFHKVKYDFCIMPKYEFSGNIKEGEKNKINYCL